MTRAAFDHSTKARNGVNMTESRWLKLKYLGWSLKSLRIQLRISGNEIIVPDSHIITIQHDENEQKTLLSTRRRYNDWIIQSNNSRSI